MNILEQEIEDIVWQAMTTQGELLADRGFPYKDGYTYVRQLDLCGYGRADIIGFWVDQKNPSNLFKTRTVYIDIIELKKDQVNQATFLQAVRYAKGLQQLFNHERVHYNLVFNFFLIGKCIEQNSDFVYLTDIFGRIDIYTYGIDLAHGLRFTRQCGYSLTEPGFQKQSKKLLPILKANVKSQYKREAERLAQCSDVQDDLDLDLDF